MGIIKKRIVSFMDVTKLQMKDFSLGQKQDCFQKYWPPLNQFLTLINANSHKKNINIIPLEL